MSDQPREYTQAEARENFLRAVWTSIEYWNQVDGQTQRERLEGLAFSILVALDGYAGNLPHFMVIPDPHPDDKAFLRKCGENWYPENSVSPSVCDISGEMHDLFNQFSPHREKI